MEQRKVPAQTVILMQRLLSALGDERVAAMLGVDSDRPAQWISGEDASDEENLLHLKDLESVTAHLQRVLTPDQARLWLEGDDPHLGARPIDVYRLEGPAPAIGAMLVHEQGAFA